MSQRDASDTTLRRKNRVIYADKVIQEQTLANGLKNYVIRQGAPQGKRAANYDIFYFPSEDGATQTTVAEQESYILSVPTLTPTTPTTLILALQIFSDVGTFTWTAPSRTTTVTYLVVGGGGGSGGGFDTGGGGGGGGGMVLTGDLTVEPGTTYIITVGDGGIGGISIRSPVSETNGSAGDDSVFGTIVALGGGGGYASRLTGGVSSAGGTSVSDGSASTGGSGGGSAGDGNGAGGGGGGSSGNGNNGVANVGGSGGAGIDNDLTGTLRTYGDGGRGANGNVTSGNTGVAGAANTGNGARGGGTGPVAQTNGAKGGSGIVVIKYFY